MKEYTEEDVNQAKYFAKKAHGNQQYGQWPYYVHLEDVERIVYKYGNAHRILAWLHDTLEDCNVTIDDLWKHFGMIANWVQMITDPSGKTRKERKKYMNSMLSHYKSGSSLIVLTVKAADRLANVRECVKNNPGLLNMYREEYDEFKKAVYRPGLCDEIWKELDTLMGLHLH